MLSVSKWYHNSRYDAIADEFSLVFKIYWKDITADIEAQRGTIYGVGMAVIPLGRGVVDVKGIYDENVSKMDLQLLIERRRSPLLA